MARLEFRADLGGPRHRAPERGLDRRGRRLRSGGLGLAGALLATLALAPSPAGGAFPGRNGRIAFMSDRDGNFEIYSMNVHGSGQTRLTRDPAADADPAFSPDGRKLAFHRRGEIHAMNADGGGVTRITTNAVASAPAFSPDGRRIAFTSFRDGNADVRVIGVDGRGQSRLTADSAFDGEPAFSPDGTRIVFTSRRDGNADVYTMRADGTGEANRTNHPADDLRPAFSPDGRRIAFRSDRDGDFEIYAMGIDGSGPTRLTRQPAFFEGGPAFSPDGTRIAFESNRHGNFEIYAMSPDGSDPTRLTTNAALDIEADWQPLPAGSSRRARGRPRVSAANLPRGCAARTFDVRIRVATATSARRATVLLDGRRLARSRRSSFRVRVPVRGLAPRGHRLTVVAVDARGRRARRSFRFRVCAATVPRFAG